MDNPQNPNPSLWGVKGLNEAEQREVRGGSRAQCIRVAIRNYTSSRRGSSSRGSLLSSLLSAIANCTSGGPV